MEGTFFFPGRPGKSLMGKVVLWSPISAFIHPAIVTNFHV
jgi:hypothetical protein